MKTTLCHHSGCQSRAVENSMYCARHASDAETARKRRSLYRHSKSGQYQRLYKTYRWVRMRRDFLAKYPQCFVCGSPATLVDHIRPHRGNEDLFFDEFNLQPMCAACHDKKTKREQKEFPWIQKGIGG